VAWRGNSFDNSKEVETYVMISIVALILVVIGYSVATMFAVICGACCCTIGRLRSSQVRVEQSTYTMGTSYHKQLLLMSGIIQLVVGGLCGLIGITQIISSLDLKVPIKLPVLIFLDICSGFWVSTGYYQESFFSIISEYYGRVFLSWSSLYVLY
jgi:hypothetical protein